MPKDKDYLKCSSLIGWVDRQRDVHKLGHGQQEVHASTDPPKTHRAKWTLHITTLYVILQELTWVTICKIGTRGWRRVDYKGLWENVRDSATLLSSCGLLVQVWDFTVCKLHLNERNEKQLVAWVPFEIRNTIQWLGYMRAEETPDSFQV